MDRGSKPYRWADAFLTCLSYLTYFGIFDLFCRICRILSHISTYLTYLTYLACSIHTYPKAGGCRKSWMVFGPTGMEVIFILAMAIRFFNPVAHLLLTLSKCHRIVCYMSSMSPSILLFDFVLHSLSKSVCLIPRPLVFVAKSSHAPIGSKRIFPQSR